MAPWRHDAIQAYSPLEPCLPGSDCRHGPMVRRTPPDDIAAMGVAISVAGFAPAIIAFEAGFLVLALWLRAKLGRL